MAIANNRSLKLFRALVPSWGFFDRAGAVPHLFYRIREPQTDSSSSFGEWKNALTPAPARRWYNLIFNPQGGEFLAYHSLLQQLIDDLDEWDENQIDRFHESVSFRLIENLAIARIPNKNSDFQYQFKLCAPDDILISPMLTWTRKRTAQ